MLSTGSCRASTCSTLFRVALCLWASTDYCRDSGLTPSHLVFLASLTSFPVPLHHSFVPPIPRLAVLLLQNAEYRFLSSLNVLNVVQSGIMFVGISLGVMACTAGVAKVRRKHNCTWLCWYSMHTVDV